LNSLQFLCSSILPMLLMSNRPSSLWEPTLPLYSREGRVQVSLGATVYSLRVLGFRMVLLRREWTSVLLWSWGSSERRLTSLRPWRLTARGCLLRPHIPRASLLEASLVAKTPRLRANERAQEPPRPWSQRSCLSYCVMPPT